MAHARRVAADWKAPWSHTLGRLLGGARTMSFFTIFVASPPGQHHAGAFGEVADTLLGALTDLGHECVVTTDPAAVRGQAIVLGANALLRQPELVPQLPTDAILYNLEQISAGSPWLDGGLVDLYRRHRMWDYSSTNIVRLAEFGVVDVELVPEFFQAVSANCGLTLHFNSPYWNNLHHVVEASFKAFAKAMDQACSLDPRSNAIPSTKGTL